LKALDWWYKAFNWFNKTYRKRALPLKKYTSPKGSPGIKWGNLQMLVVKGLGLTSTGGLYTQHYIDYYILKNAPISNPPVKRPRKPVGYDEWLERQEDLQ
jgi:hypothetical protein